MRQISDKYLKEKKKEEKRVARTYYLEPTQVTTIDEIAKRMNWDKVEVIRRSLNLFIKDFYTAEGKN